MHASLAFVNGAGNKRRTPIAKTDPEGLLLLNALLSTATAESPHPAADRPRSAADKGKTPDGRQAEDEGRAENQAVT